MLIFLIGYMGCGKSSIGRRLAARLRVPFVDMDTEIERREGLSVSEIFARYGEAHFRRVEREVLADLCAMERGVVATGGGVPCGEGNMARMNRAGLTVYFRMSPDKLVRRLEHGRDKRPLIRHMDDEQLLAYISEHLARREPFYAQAGLVVACDHISDDYIARHIELYVENNGGGRAVAPEDAP